MAVIEVDISKEVEAVVRKVQNEFMERLDKIEKQVKGKQHKRWMKQREAAKYLDVSVTTFRSLADKFEDFPKPTYLSEVNVIYDREELDTWMKKHRRVKKTRPDIKYE